MSVKLPYISGITDAKGWANALVLFEARGPGDTEGAMRRLEHRYGIPWRTFWSLRYRAPCDVMVGVYRQLQNAYTDECQRQERLLAHERRIAEAKVLAFEALVGADTDGDSGSGI